MRFYLWVTCCCFFIARNLQVYDKTMDVWKPNMWEVVLRQPRTNPECMYWYNSVTGQSESNRKVAYKSNSGRKIENHIFFFLQATVSWRISECIYRLQTALGSLLRSAMWIVPGLLCKFYMNVKQRSYFSVAICSHAGLLFTAASRLTAARADHLLKGHCRSSCSWSKSPQCWPHFQLMFGSDWAILSHVKAKFRAWMDPCSPLWPPVPAQPQILDPRAKRPNIWRHFLLSHNITIFSPRPPKAARQTPNLAHRSAQCPQDRPIGSRSANAGQDEPRIQPITRQTYPKNQKTFQYVYPRLEIQFKSSIPMPITPKKHITTSQNTNFPYVFPRFSR